MNKNAKKVIALGLALSIGMGTNVVMGADENSSRYFTDVNSDSYGWAMEAVDYLCAKGVTHGVGDNKYNPAGVIERGDFAVLVDNQFELPTILDYMVTYGDVADGSYYKQAITNLKGNDLVSNTGMFFPEAGITRIDAMRILYKALNLQGYLKGTGSTDLSMYEDGSQITDVNDRIAVGNLTKMGIVSGSEGKILPNDTMNRAQMAVIMYNTLKYMEDFTSENTNQTSSDNNTAENTETTTEAVGEAVVATDTVNVEAGETKSFNSSNITVNEGSKNGMIVYGVANVLQSSVITDALNAYGIVVKDGGKLSFENSSINAKGVDSIGMLVEEGGNAEINNSNAVVSDKTAIGIKSYGSTVLKGANVTASNSEAIRLMGKATATFEDCVLKGTGNGVLAMYANEKKNKEDVMTIDVANTTFDCGKGAALYANDAKATINLNGGVTFENCAKLISTGYLYQREITTGAEIVINLRNGQSVEGDVTLDDMSEVTIDIGSGSTYKGIINKTSSGKMAKVVLDKNGVWEFDDTSYLAVIVDEDKDFNNIKDHGHVVYYDTSYAENDYLDGDTYSLPMGGELRPL